MSSNLKNTQESDNDKINSYFRDSDELPAQALEMIEEFVEDISEYRKKVDSGQLKIIVIKNFYAKIKIKKKKKQFHQILISIINPL